ncbi:hypothetical protein PSTG_13667 [Puccinia striiformis f. sp. tritici PST-78]|uniref:Uncharacterized protein n=1 Tax=Puccinia striiformis f. sp. tritici PST-78 TaxID=1165861 RepID=A0A0L0V125_9BASI|nr:hypothetical protein PSTG_13667 [Puccinia striiformis f. sp. tritici PST-78]
MVWQITGRPSQSRTIHLFLQSNFPSIHPKHGSYALPGSLFGTINTMQVTLLVLLAGVCESVVSGGLAIPLLDPACCSSGSLDQARVYIPIVKDQDCRKTLSDIPYYCPKGVLQPIGSMKLREAQSHGCKPRSHTT